MTATLPDFNSLSEADRRAVAERLLRIEESGWKPFWCADPECDGMPHWAVTADDEYTFVKETETSGPLGQPVGEMLWETADGEWFASTGVDATEPIAGDKPIGRPVLDPTWAHNHARADQRLLPWQEAWTLFIMSGRGSGKTRTGVEFVTLCARKGLTGAILGRRGTELVNTHVAEIIANAHPEFVPTHWASKDILEWPNGAITYLFSAEKPENIRSVNLSYAWVDEAAFMDEIATAWMNLKLATRVRSPGNPIHILITSTPTGTKWVMDMEDDEDVVVRRVSTYANRANLDSDFLSALEKEYEGTRMGRQELHGEVLRDVEGALWNDDIFVQERAEGLAAFEDWLATQDDRIVAIDPAGTANKRSDQTGIIATGVQRFDEDGVKLRHSRFTVLGDATLKGSPSEWAAQAFKLARQVRASRIVAEKNFGGDMVKQVLNDYAELHPDTTCNEDGEKFKIDVVHAKSTEAKETRAEPCVGRYEQGRVTHLRSDQPFGDLSMLEREQVTWVPRSRGGRHPSPNRIDALVWAMWELDTKVKFESSMATSKDIMSRMNRTPRGITGGLADRLNAAQVEIPESAPVQRIDTTMRKRRTFEIKRPVKRQAS